MGGMRGRPISAPERRLAPRFLAALVGGLSACALLLLSASPAAAKTKRVNYRAMDDQAERVFFKGGGLRLVGDCDPDDEMAILARSKYEDAMLHANSQGAGPSDSYGEEDDFDQGQANQLDLLDGLLGVDDSASGQIVYARPGGKVVTIDWAAEESDAYGSARDCVFVGVARIVDSSSSGRINFRSAAGTAERTIFDGGLRIDAECTPAGDLRIEATVSTSGEVITDGTAIHINAQSPAGTAYDEDDSIDPGLESLDIPGEDDSSAGQLIHAGASVNGGVTVDWAAEDADGGDGIRPLGGTRDCAFVGTARAGVTGFSPQWFGYGANSVSPLTGFLQRGGLKMHGECQAGGEPNFFVSSDSDHALVHQNGQRLGPAAFYDERDSLNADPDDRFDLFGGFGVDEDDGIGQIVYSSFETGKVVAVDWFSEEDIFSGSFGGECVFLGTAEVASP